MMKKKDKKKLIMSVAVVGIILFSILILFVLYTQPSAPPVEPPIIPPVCGNGILEEGEVCDDGDTRLCGGCSADCSRVQPLCGDGIVECGEWCDDGNTIDGDGCSSCCMREGVPE